MKCRHLVKIVGTNLSNCVFSGGSIFKNDQTVAVVHLHFGLAGIVHVEDVGLLDGHVTGGQVVTPEHSGDLTDVQLDLGRLVEGDVLHLVDLDAPGAAEGPGEALDDVKLLVRRPHAKLLILAAHFLRGKTGLGCFKLLIRNLSERRFAINNWDKKIFTCSVKKIHNPLFLSGPDKEVSMTGETTG